MNLDVWLRGVKGKEYCMGEFGKIEFGNLILSQGNRDRGAVARKIG